MKLDQRALALKGLFGCSGDEILLALSEDDQVHLKNLDYFNFFRN